MSVETHPSRHLNVHSSIMKRIRRVLASPIIRWGFVAVAAGLGGYAIASSWPAVHHGLDRIGTPFSLLALAATLAALAALMQSWRVLLAGLGSPLSFPAAARVFFIGQLGKYLPGSVWPVLAQMELAVDQRVPRLRTVAASIVSMLVTLLAALITALVTLPFKGGSTPYLWAFLALPPALACLHPKVLGYLIGRALRLARQPPLNQPLTREVLVAALGWSFLAWVLFGVQAWLLAVRVGASAGVAVPLSIGGFALAWSVGFIVVPVPAGAGVRELVLVWVLTHAAGMTVAAATAVALVSRAVSVAGDLITAGAATPTYRRGRARAAPSSAMQLEEPAAESKSPLPVPDA